MTNKPTLTGGASNDDGPTPEPTPGSAPEPAPAPTADPTPGQTPRPTPDDLPATQPRNAAYYGYATIEPPTLPQHAGDRNDLSLQWQEDEFEHDVDKHYRCDNPTHDETHNWDGPRTSLEAQTTNYGSDDRDPERPRWGQQSLQHEVQRHNSLLPLAPRPRARSISPTKPMTQTGAPSPPTPRAKRQRCERRLDRRCRRSSHDEA